MITSKEIKFEPLSDFFRYISQGNDEINNICEKLKNGDILTDNEKLLLLKLMTEEDSEEDTIDEEKDIIFEYIKNIVCKTEDEECQIAQDKFYLIDEFAERCKKVGYQKCLSDIIQNLYFNDYSKEEIEFITKVTI